MLSGPSGAIAGGWHTSTPYPDILFALSFLDAVACPLVGPDMGPFINDPKPQLRCQCIYANGFGTVYTELGEQHP